MGRALLEQGRFTDARDATRKAFDLLPPNDDRLRPLTSRQLQRCEKLLALDEKLPAVLKGEVKPTDAAECLALADLCQQYKQRYVAAARFYADAFAAEPKRAESLNPQHRYNAACAAALADCGQGKDDPPPDDKARTRLRQQALDWLGADLAQWAKELDPSTPQARTAVQRTLTHWQIDPDLVSVRGPEALAQLPEAARPAWQKLWTDVDALLDKARDAK